MHNQLNCILHPQLHLPTVPDPDSQVSRLEKLRPPWEVLSLLWLPHLPQTAHTVNITASNSPMCFPYMW